jgi:ABC-type transport system involved in multi-copper enzyme maturation permease subunit
MSEMTRLMNAEWIKLRSLRSTKWTLAAMVITTVGLGAIFNAEAASHWSTFSAHDKAAWDPTNSSLVGTVFGQLAIAVFGVLAVTSEYSSGTIRSSVAAAPRRTRLLAAKVAVYGGLALVVGELISFTSYFIGQQLFSGSAPISHFTDPGVIRAITMTGGYLAVVCLIAIGVSIALRHTAGAITTMVAVLLVLPAILAALPTSLQNSIERFLPEQIAASSTGAVLPEPHYFGPWAGMALLLSYAAAVLALGGWTFARRDVS